MALAAKEADGSFNIQKFEQMVAVTEKLAAATGENRDVVADAVAKYMQGGEEGARGLAAILKTTKADLKPGTCWSLKDVQAAEAALAK